MLLMPIVGYEVFNKTNEYAITWGIYMRVPEDLYYGFMIPANLALIVGTERSSRVNNRDVIRSILEKLKKNPHNAKIGIVLTLVGFFAALLQNFVPQALAFILYLIAMLKFVGPLYLYYSDFNYRKLALYGSILVFLLQAVTQGLFGEFIVYLLLMFIIISTEMKLAFFSKLFVVATAIFLVLIVQSVKRTYRTITWMGKDVNGLSVRTSSNTSIFYNLIIDKFENLETLLDEGSFFFTYIRMNQGFLVSRVMDYVPRVEDYANGSTIVRSLGAIIVPRFLWPDKPEAGGRENLSRFMGIKKRHNFSMNIGPYGEAYGNFGPVVGVGFILLYGLLLSFMLSSIIKRSFLTPSLLLWLPLLFYYTLTVETDLLTTLNSFFKGLIFMVVVYFIARRFFNVNP
jgi:hypothetical protein